MAKNHFRGSSHRIALGAKDSFLTESFTDCELVSKEGIPINVHKVVLSPCSTLKKIFLDNACCRGKCEHQAVTSTTVLLPDIKYKYLKISVDFLYKGILRCSVAEKKNVLEVMKVLGMNRNIKVVPWAKDHVHCEICSNYIPKQNMVEHMFKNHIRKPAKRDLAMVAKGDNTRVKCSYNSSECKLDKDVHRISNGFFNYVGKPDPSLCVKEHYANIHLDVILHNIRNDYGINFDEEKVTRFKDILFGLDGSEENTRDEDDDVDINMEDLSFDDDDGIISSRSSYSDGMHTSGDDTDESDEDMEDCEEDNNVNYDLEMRNTVRSEDMTLYTRDTSDNIPEKKRKLSENKDPTPSVGATKREYGEEVSCRYCSEKVQKSFFIKHLTKHKYELWSPEEVSREDGERDCPLSGCQKKKIKGWKNMIKHLATIHDELNKKLKDNDESLSDYELPLQFEDEDPETQIARTIKAARTDPEDILMLKKDKNLILPADFDLTSTSQEKRNDFSSGQDGMQKTGDISVDDVEDLLSPPPQEEDAKSPTQNGDSDTTVDFNT